MPNVQLPDNSIVAFPDDMPEADINSAIETHMTGNQPTGALNAFNDKASDMITFGMDKPITAAGISAINYAKNAITGSSHQNYGDLYDQNMAQQNNIENIESEKHPIASGLGDAAGFIGSMGISAPSKIAQIAPGAWNTLKAIGSSARNNAVIGAALNEANTFANTAGGWDEKIGSIPTAGIEGAAIGSTLPMMASGIIAGGSAVASPIINKLTSSDSEIAISKLAKRFAQDNNITLDQAKTVLEQLGPNASLADVGATNVQKLGKTILNTPGSGANNVVNFLMGRQRGIDGELQDAVKIGFGNDAEFHDTIDNLQAGKQEMADPLYKQAFAENQDIKSPKLNRLLRTNAGQNALSYAADRMNNKMSLMGIPDPDLAEQARLVGTYQPGGISNGFKLQTHDFIKQGFDAQISAGKKQVANGSMKPGELSDIISLKNAYTNELDRLDSTTKINRLTKEPEQGSGLYAQARAAFSNPSQSSDATEMGRNFMNEDSQMTTKEISKLDPSDQYFFQIGAARAIADKAKANPSSTIKNILSNDLWKERLKAAMPSQDHYYNFLNDAQNIATKNSTKANVLGNSSTASQLKDMAEEGQGLPSMPYNLNIGNIIDASQGDLKGTALQIGKHYFNKIMAPKPTVAENLSNMLFSSNPQQNSATLQAWQQHLMPAQSSPYNAFGNAAANMAGIQAARTIQ